MNYDQVRDMLVTQWTYTGGPNEDKASEFYHDDAVLEFPSRASASRARRASPPGAGSTRPGSSSSPASFAAAATCGWPRPGCATTAASRSAS